MTARLPAAVVARRPVSGLARRARAHNVPIARRIICLSLAERILGTFVRPPHYCSALTRRAQRTRRWRSLDEDEQVAALR